MPTTTLCVTSSNQQSWILVTTTRTDSDQMGVRTLLRIYRLGVWALITLLSLPLYVYTMK